MKTKYWIYMFVMVVLTSLAILIDGYAILIFGSTMIILCELEELDRKSWLKSMVSTEEFTQIMNQWKSSFRQKTLIIKKEKSSKGGEWKNKQ